MKTKPTFLLGLLTLLSTLSPQLSTLFAQGTAFTYQGRLTAGGNAVTGLYDLTFKLYSAQSGGSQVGSQLTVNAAEVTNGLFAITLDFGVGIFAGDNRWLEIAVRTNAVGTFNTLAGRQPLTPSPYAIHAANAITAASATSVASNAVGSTELQSSSVTSDEIADGSVMAADVNAGSFSTTFWKVDGNTGTTPGTHFLGTTDNQPLELKANNARALRIEPTATSPNIVAGYQGNLVIAGADATVIAGGGRAGAENRAEAALTFIGGGWANTNGGGGAFLGGGFLNRIEGNAFDAVIAGGRENRIGRDSFQGVVSGGLVNRIGSNTWYAAIGGGFNNLIDVDADYSAIGGGVGNTIQFNAESSVIAGGNENLIQTNAQGVHIGGGFRNSVGIESHNSVIGGGNSNRIDRLSRESVIGGGVQNSVGSNSIHGVVAGGLQNAIGADNLYSAVGGGYGNRIAGDADVSVIGGGYLNSIGTNAEFNVIGGGQQNAIQTLAGYAVISGGLQNTIHTNADFSTISGGRQNVIQNSASLATISGGFANTIQSNAGFAVIGGGGNNIIQTNAQLATIAGGYFNRIETNAIASSIGGGMQNSIASGSAYATVAGGFFNHIASNGQYGVIGGGGNNRIEADAQHATVPGGFANVAYGNASFAAGNLASAEHDGAFVWSDFQPVTFSSTTSNQFNVRASGGVRLMTAGAGLTVDGQAVVAGGSGAVSLTNPANVFVGNGAGLTSLNASQLTSGTVPAAALSNAWKLTGNAGTTPGTHFIGTTDNQALEFKVNNIRAFRLQPSPAAVPSPVGGSSQNSVDASLNGAFIGGGLNNDISGVGDYAVVAGGRQNAVSNGYAAVVGGYNNEASAVGAFVGGGGNGGGLAGRPRNNVASGAASVVVGGFFNSAEGNSSFVGGGRLNTAAGSYAAIAGGYSNSTAASYAFAAGQRAKATNDGAFVWADSQDADFASTANNQFNVRAAGGVRLETGGSGLTLDGPDILVHRAATGGLAGAAGFDFNTNAGAPVAGLVIEQGIAEGSGIYFDGDYISLWSPGDQNRLLRVYDEDGMVEKFYIDGLGNAVANGVVLTSSRRFKEHVLPIEHALEKVLLLQGVSFDWTKDHGGKPGIGFVAEDVARVFPELVLWEEGCEGRNATGLQYANLTAVNVEAIKELDAKVKVGNQKAEDRSRILEERLKRKETEIAELQQTVNELKELVQTMNEKLKGN